MHGEKSNHGSLFSGYAGRMLLIMSIGYVVMNVGRYVLPPVLPELQADLAISRTETGILLTVLTAAIGVFQYPGGQISDSLNRTTVIVPSFIIAVAGLVLLGGASSFALALFGCLVFGLGVGVYSATSRAFLSDLFEARRGGALGVFTAGHDLGGGIASGVAILVLAVGAWRAAFVPLAVALLVSTAAFIALTRESYVVGRPEFELLETGRRLLGTRDQMWVLVSFSLFFFMINGVLYFLPVYLRDAKGFSPQLASGAFALLFLLGILVKPGAGIASDRIPRQVVATGSMLTGTAALVLLLAAETTVPLLAAVALFAIGYKGLYPVIDAILLDAAPVGKAAGDLGAAKTWFQGIGSVSPAFVGFAADVADFTAAFTILTACLFAAGVILAWRMVR